MTLDTTLFSSTVDRFADYPWSLADGNLLSEQALVSLELPTGSHQLNLTVVDSSGNSALDTVEVDVYQPRNFDQLFATQDVVRISALDSDELSAIPGNLHDRLVVSESEKHVQMTPIAVADGYVYTINIEQGPEGDFDGIGLPTILRKGFFSKRRMGLGESPDRR